MTLKLVKLKLIGLLTSSLLITSCGNFPDYEYDKSEDYCMMSFPFAGGFITKKYVGYFRFISSLQYLDADPTYKVIVTGPSHIELEPGSFQKLIINDKVFKPKFKRSHIEGELQLWGPAFVFNEKDSTEIYHLMQQGYDLEIKGRLEVGHQYDTDVYNIFFSSKDEKFRACINRLLDPEDLERIKQSKQESVGQDQQTNQEQQQED